MKQPILLMDRVSQKIYAEKIYGESILRWLYQGSFLSRLALDCVARCPWVSSLYGALQNTSWSRRKILPFIEEFEIDTREFLEPVTSYRSFNDFFTRKLRPEARPIDPEEDVAIIPADGRYFVREEIEGDLVFSIKNQSFSLYTLLRDTELAKAYEGGSLVVARLAPPDYHRFHFPFSCTPSEPRNIQGPLFSVHPIALAKNWGILAENKRVVTCLDSASFGKVLYIEVGATNVGTILQTHSPNTMQPKGAEKGYFSFGGSCLLLLFAKGKLQIDADMKKASSQGLEMRCLMGQSLGRRRG